MYKKDNLFPEFQETITGTCLTYMLFNNFKHHYYDDDDMGVRLYSNCNYDTNTTNDNDDTSNNGNNDVQLINSFYFQVLCRDDDNLSIRKQ